MAENSEKKTEKRDKAEKKVEKVASGLPRSDSPRWHFDIYAIFEAPQELYFGDEKEVNVNIVEKVRVCTPQGEKEKCYISPTKRRGVERRCLLWSDAAGDLLMDRLNCGIPDTCCHETCPVCAVYGGLRAGLKTFIGRLTHSGGVAVSCQIAAEKQRAMHPALIYKEKDHTPMPYRKEYAQPGILYPVSNHCLSITDDEFNTVAYAFLMSLNRLGAGNPKGVALARASWKERAETGESNGAEPLLVVDRYRVPFGERPIISPSITDNTEAVKTFIDLSGNYRRDTEKFRRYTGSAALGMLQDAAAAFELKHLSGNSGNGGK